MNTISNKYCAGVDDENVKVASINCNFSFACSFNELNSYVNLAIEHTERVNSSNREEFLNSLSEEIDILEFKLSRKENLQSPLRTNWEVSCMVLYLAKIWKGGEGMVVLRGNDITCDYRDDIDKDLENKS